MAKVTDGHSRFASLGRPCSETGSLPPERHLTLCVFRCYRTGVRTIWAAGKGWCARNVLLRRFAVTEDHTQQTENLGNDSG
jgi:hypothetical protein